VVCSGIESEIARDTAAPVVGLAEKLGLIRRILIECGSCDVGKELVRSGLLDFFKFLEGDGL